MIKPILSLSAGAAVALSVFVAPASADVTGAKQITCELQRTAHCRPVSGCNWKAVSAHQKSGLLKVNFESREAFFVRGDNSQRFGFVARSEKVGGVHIFYIAHKKGELDERRMLVMRLKSDGALNWSRRSSRSEAACKAG